MVERHRSHMVNALHSVDSAIIALDQWSEEIASFELQHAEEEIQRITGAIVDTDVLDTIFRSICIGK